MQSELIISTYNSEQALDLVLCALTAQRCMPDSIAIADDGSGPLTAALIQTHKADLPLRHVWHEDNGFNKNAVLNKTIASSNADFLIFIDGDCLAHPDFIARHINLANPKGFSTGSVVRLGADTTEGLTKDDIQSGQVFQTDWLASKGELGSLRDRLKAGCAPHAVSDLLERISPVRLTWSGGNASTFRQNLIAVNGFDESMRYGGEDKELGARLLNLGLKGRFLRYSAPLLHMHHQRGYVDPEIVTANRARILQTRRQKSVWAELGLSQHL